MDKKKLELNEEQLDRVAGGTSAQESWECDECGAVHYESWEVSDKICKTCGFRNDIMITYNPANLCPHCGTIMDFHLGWSGRNFTSALLVTT